MNVSLTKCRNNCCHIAKKYVETTVHDFRHKFNREKAGIILYDPINTRLLLVQSHGYKWGPPKGTVEEGETFEQCAIRETIEETGIEVKEHELSFPVQVNNKTKYFYVERISDPNIQIGTATDATGISWIHLDCIQDIGEVNSHCKKIVSLLKNKILLIK